MWPWLCSLFFKKLLFLMIPSFWNAYTNIIKQNNNNNKPHFSLLIIPQWPSRKVTPCTKEAFFGEECGRGGNANDKIKSGKEKNCSAWGSCNRLRCLGEWRVKHILQLQQLSVKADVEREKTLHKESTHSCITPWITPLRGVNKKASGTSDPMK